MTHLIPSTMFGGDGPILHFAHANAYPPECYRQFLTPFTERFDVRGMWQRPLWPNQQPENFSGLQEGVADLIRFLDQEGFRDVVGMGHSLGAMLTMLACVQRPDLFRQLVLIDPVFLSPSIFQALAQLPQPTPDNPWASKARNRRNKWPDKQSAFDLYREKPVFAAWSDDTLWDYVNNNLVLDEQGQMTLRYSREWEARFYELVTTQGAGVWEALPKLTCPTVAVRAVESDTLFPEAWQLWQTLQPDTVFVELPDVSHMLVMERPSWVAETILGYL